MTKAIPLKGLDIEEKKVSLICLNCRLGKMPVCKGEELDRHKLSCMSILIISEKSPRPGTEEGEFINWENIL